MAFESLTMWLVVGSVAGLLAGVIVEGYGLGTLGNVAVGVLGAIIAGAMFSRANAYGERDLGSVVVFGILGAATLLALLRYIPRK